MGRAAGLTRRGAHRDADLNHDEDALKVFIAGLGHAIACPSRTAAPEATPHPLVAHTAGGTVTFMLPAARVTPGHPPPFASSAWCCPPDWTRGKTNMFQRSLLAIVTAAFAFGALPTAAHAAATSAASDPVAARMVQALPADVSRALKLTRMPTTQSTPFIFGNYWHCEPGDYGLDRCRLVLVVCTNDQSMCFEI
jgi:hypothetical protein